MSSDIEHKSQANHNENMVTMIEKTDTKKKFLDWKYIALYYSALHFGDAFLARKGFDIVDNHDDRRNKYAQVLSKAQFSSYKKLESRSIIARYYPEKKSSNLNETDFKKCYTEHFLKIKSLL
jgi:hypothetical protein